MAWRLLLRRCPSRSMTVVGDLAQTGRLAGGASWAEALGGSVADRSRTAELAVNYRTPAEIMDVAARVLAHINPSARPPRSVRRTGVAPWGVAVPPARLAARLAQAVSEQVSEQVEGEGRLGVIVPAGRLDELGRAVVEAEPGAAVGPAADLTNRVVVLTAVQAKGLEFDDVLVADPDGIVAGSPRGYSDLYVALTRATRGSASWPPGRCRRRCAVSSSWCGRTPARTWRR